MFFVTVTGFSFVEHKASETDGTVALMDELLAFL